MCSSCTTTTKKYWTFGCGSFFLLFALILGLLWPTISLSILYDQLVLREGTRTYDSWMETPIPMYLEIYFFNWENADQVHNYQNVKPHFTEMGPYIFSEKHFRTDVIWNDNGTVTFNQIKVWQFEPGMSNGTLEDTVTNLNVISNTAAYTLRSGSSLLRLITNYMLKTRGGSLMNTKTVRELLFEGYDDPLLDFLKELKIPTINIPFSKFGWFAERNESSTYDGTFNMFTGEHDIRKLGVMSLWNGNNRTNFYRDKCGVISGTTGELWPPISGKEDISLFITDFCRPIKLAYKNEISSQGIDGGKWVGDYRVFDNGRNYEPNSCYCTADVAECPDLPSGIQNVSECKFGAPAFISFPHFYLADPTYLNNIEGMHPNEEEHEFYVSMEPTTGIPLKVRAALQLNLLLQPIERLEMYSNVPKMVVPMFWFKQTAELTEDLANETKTAFLLLDIGMFVSYGLAALGTIIIVVGVVLTVTKWKHRDDEDTLLR